MMLATLPVRVPLRVRLRVQPFEFAMGAYALLSAGFSLAGFGPIAWGMDILFPRPAQIALDILYGLGGALIVGGIATGFVRYEVGGLSILVSGALARILILAVLGWEQSAPLDYAGIMLFHLFMVAGASGRAFAVMKDDITVVLRGSSQ